MSLVRCSWTDQGFGVYEIDILPTGPQWSPSSKEADGYLVPGFIDIHIHGAQGIDFMSADSQRMDQLCTYLKAKGYEGFLPTTVTAPLSEVESAVFNLIEHDMVLGFHLEGPFISPKHPGAQPEDWIRPPNEGIRDWRSVLEHPRLKVVTFAPEEPGGNELASMLSQRGVIPSLGHSDATYDQATMAANHGVRHATHTYNAMRGLHHREPGCVGFVMTSPKPFYAELVYDRHHVSRPAADALVRCVGQDWLIAVSDSSAATGMADGVELSMWGHECVVSEGTVRLASNGALAGSAVTLLECFKNLAEDFSWELAVHACSLNPRKALGLSTPPKVWVDLDSSWNLRTVFS